MMIKCSVCGGEIHPYQSELSAGQHDDAEYCIGILQMRANALAAEVERLTGDVAYWKDAQQETLRYYEGLAVEADEELAALRAQLDAGEGWRAVEGDPPDGAIQIRTMAEVIQLDPSEDFELFGIDEGAFICKWSAGNGWQWRPAPPQE